MRLLSIDYGERYTGYCLSDNTGSIPSKTGIIEGKGSEVIEKIKRIVNEYAVLKVIVGIPVGLKGTDTRKTAEVREFVELLRQSLDVEVVEVDERYSTVEAAGILRGMGIDTKKGKKKLNEIAASLILETYLRGKR